MRLGALTLSVASIRRRALATTLTVTLLSLGVATIVVLLLFQAQLDQRLARDAHGIDLVVGAKGSGLQLVLSAVFHVDVPSGNIPMDEARSLVQHPMVAAAYPLALGDAYAGFRIVGTTPAYAAHYNGRLVRGGWWDAELEAVLGSAAAARTGLDIGDHFEGAHGIRGEGGHHGEHPYRVVGVLAATGTVLDRLVLTSVESVWRVHAPDEKRGGAGAPQTAPPPSDEITALLIRYRSPVATVTFPRMVNSRSALQAASPAFETAKLFALVGVGTDAIGVFAVILILSAALSLFVALYTALEEQRFDLAVMRSLGASRGRVFWHLLGQGLLLGGAGTVLGILVGHLATEAAAWWLRSSAPLPFTGSAWEPEEALVLLAGLAIAVVAALVPAARAYRLDIARVLAER